MFLDPSICVFVWPRTIGLILYGVSLLIDELVLFFPFCFRSVLLHHISTFQGERQRKESLFPLMRMSGDANYGVCANTIV
jgi:hypothetical protein